VRRRQVRCEATIAAGRCAFTTDGLLAVADLADRFRVQCDGDRV
jgi:hypothetical protein